jgi:hypothetical protein
MKRIRERIHLVLELFVSSSSCYPVKKLFSIRIVSSGVFVGGENRIPRQTLRSLSVLCGANRAISRRAAVTTATFGATCGCAAVRNGTGSLRRDV